MSRILKYESKDTWIDRLCGVSKLLFFLAWSMVSMITYDTRVLLVMLVISFIIFRLSKTDWKQVGTVFKFILVFLTLNLLAIFIFSPYEGVKIYGSRTDLFHLFWIYTITKEQIFYELNIMIKYFTVIPAVLMFIVTTNPSEFASSLNRIGIGYKAGYSVSIALRYIPDVQSDFMKIKHAQEARGIEMSPKAKFMERIKSMATIIFPLIFSSMDRIDTVSNAMELRGFGKHTKRTWYSGKPLQKNDYLTILFVVVFSIVSLIVTFADGSRFYNPFV